MVAKTTTLRMLAGLVAPDTGTATINGHPHTASPTPGRAAGVVLEAAGFHPGRSGRDHLRVYCTACGYLLSRADEVLGLTGLTRLTGRAGGGCAAIRSGCGSAWRWPPRCSATRRH